MKNMLKNNGIIFAIKLYMYNLLIKLLKIM